MNVLDLFSGIGGFSLGLERAGMRTVAFCEIDPFCRRILAKHWQTVPVYDDVRTLTAERLRADGIVADVICGGFPCQDISVAGKGAGIGGVQSGLWSEYARIIGEVRPRYVIVENVAALLGRGLSVVLGDLAALGFDAEWHCIPASAVGAPHRRDRIWIVAYPGLGKLRHEPGRRNGARWAGAPEPGDNGAVQSMADARAMDRVAFNSTLRRYTRDDGLSQRQEGSGTFEPSCGDVADANRPRLEIRLERYAGGEFAATDWWLTEPDVGRVAHGISERVDRLRALGNAVIPQIPEIIGRAIMKAHHG